LVVSVLVSMAVIGCAPRVEPVEEPTPVEPVEEEPAPEPAEPIEIAMVVKNLGNPFFEAAKKGGEEAAAEVGATFIFDAPATPTAEGQIEIIDALIARGVDVIAVSANDPEALVPVGKKAMEAGIKMVTWDSAIAPEGRQIFVNQADMEQIGRIQVQMLAEMIDYEGEIAILSAAAGMTNQE
ncbi:rhamnose transport system substrate-binding protein, partial [Candidatus Hakubella thermalkaliphila]